MTLSFQLQRQWIRNDEPKLGKRIVELWSVEMKFLSFDFSRIFFFFRLIQQSVRQITSHRKFLNNVVIITYVRSNSNSHDDNLNSDFRKPIGGH